MSLLEMTDVAVTYEQRGRSVRAVAGVDLTVERGEIVGLVGESGCGKSTLAKAAVGLVPTSGGSVRFDGTPVVPLGRRSRPVALRRMQMVFQDPYSSLNPRRRVGDQIEDGLTLAAGFRGDRRARIAELLDRVQLPTDAARRYPHEFSGGQRQRLAIARALAAEPSLVVADEAISALDASAQAAVANLLVTLTRELDMGLLFISHDLAIVRQVADEIAVMYLGKVVEAGPTTAVWNDPAHPYTAALIGAVPIPDGSGALPVDLPGDVPDPAAPPSGCRFHPRCPQRFGPCAGTEPTMLQLGSGRQAACWLNDRAVVGA
ncbi:MAG: ABC transporter ATP-binding protein [Nakamurella sp.]